MCTIDDIEEMELFKGAGRRYLIATSSFSMKKRKKLYFVDIVQVKLQ